MVRQTDRGQYAGHSSTPRTTLKVPDGSPMTKQAEALRRAFFGDGLFDWQIPPDSQQRDWWERFIFDTDKWWGSFPRTDQADGDPDDGQLFFRYPWSIGPFQKHSSNPVLAPSSGRWDE